MTGATSKGRLFVAVAVVATLVGVRQLDFARAATVAGSAWYREGTISRSGPTGTVVSVYATHAQPGTPYRLMSGTNGGNPAKPCSADLQPINVNVRHATPLGQIGVTSGVITRSPGTWQICFVSTDGQTSTSYLTFVVPGSTLVEPRLGVAGDVVPCAAALHDFPDTAIAVYRPGPAQLEVYLTAGATEPAQGVTYRCTGPSLGRLTPDPPGPVLTPSGTGWDRHYAGISAVINPEPGTNPNLRIAYYHGEQHCVERQLLPSANAVGIAISTDGGRTWQERRQLVGSDRPMAPCDDKAPPVTGVGQPTAIVVDQFVYVLFTDWTPGRANAIGIARAPIAEAQDVSAYRKYLKSASGEGWSSPALSGEGSAVLTRDDVVSPAPAGTSHLYAAQPQVTYNVALGAFLAVFETNIGFAVAKTSDRTLVNWSDAQVVFGFEQPQIVPTPPAGALWQSYPTVLAASLADPSISSDSNYLYFGQGRRGPSGEPHHLVRTWFVFGPPALPARVQLQTNIPWAPSAEQSPFAWICGGDFAVSIPPTAPPSALYDNDGTTGVVVGLASGNEVTTWVAPYGGSCEAALPEAHDALLAQVVARAHATGCANAAGCAAVRVVTLDSAGRLKSDAWR